MKKINILEPIRINNFTEINNGILLYWNKFLKLNLNSEVNYAIYCNYESNYKGNYDFSIGTDIYFENSLEFNLPDLEYKIFSCTKNEIIKKWKEIWELEESNKLNRMYKVDFEKHYANGNVEIFISILK